MTEPTPDLELRQAYLEWEKRIRGKEVPILWTAFLAGAEAQRKIEERERETQQAGK